MLFCGEEKMKVGGFLGSSYGGTTKMPRCSNGLVDRSLAKPIWQTY